MLKIDKEKHYLWKWDRDQVIQRTKDSLYDYMKHLNSKNEKWWEDPKLLDDVGEGICDYVFSEDMNYILIYEE